MTLIKLMVAATIAAALSMVILIVFIDKERSRLKEKLLATESDRFDLTVKGIEIATKMGECKSKDEYEFDFIREDGSTVRLFRVDSFLVLNRDSLGSFDSIVFDTTDGLMRLTLRRSGRWRIICWR